MILERIRKRSELLVPALLLAASVVLLSYGSHGRRHTSPSLFSRALMSAVGGGQSAVSVTIDGIRDLARHYAWLRGVERENERLLRQVRELKRENYHLREQAIENERLRRLLKFKPRKDIESWIPAQVRADDLSGLYKTVSINKGSLHGIKPRMAVITYESALVGQILDEPGSNIGYTVSQVLLLTDSRSRVEVMVQRPGSRAKGILVGRPESDECELLYVDRLADVREGDLLISSGYGGVFIKGWPAGRVVEIERDPSRFYPRIRVEPVADFSRLEEVMVIVPPGREK